MLKLFRWNTCGLFVAALLAPSAASGQMADHPSATKFASAYNWRQSPVSPPALAPGANTITLSPCPRGLRVANP
ncbi:MAG TPA: hypothetical protein VND65_08505, partial [Candidatus Binatia bacterium]|nr:hypothetical protein [Candidatus Binatia bacterium]